MIRKRSLFVVLSVALLCGATAAWSLPPTACFSITQNSCSNFDFDASCSTDDNGISFYTWYFDSWPSNSSQTITKATGQSINQSFASGFVQVTLLVRDAAWAGGQGDVTTACIAPCCVGPCGSCQ